MKLVIKINKKQARLIIQSVPKGCRLRIRGDAWTCIFDLNDKEHNKAFIK
mgnify:CR=1 FL=1